MKLVLHSSLSLEILSPKEKATPFYRRSSQTTCEFHLTASCLQASPPVKPIFRWPSLDFKSSVLGVLLDLGNLLESCTKFSISTTGDLQPTMASPYPTEQFLLRSLLRSEEIRATNNVIAFCFMPLFRVCVYSLDLKSCCAVRYLRLFVQA